MSSEIRGPFRTIVNHDYFEAVVDHAMAQILGSRSESIFILVGPAQAGKSTVAQRIRYLLRENYKSEMTENSAMVPYTSAKLVWERRVGVDFKHLYGQLLVNANELPDERESAIARRDRLRVVTKTRSVRTVFIDEGQQAVRTIREDGAVENLRALKNLAVVLSCPIFVTTTYPLLKYLDAEPEIRGRSWVIHLPPYGCANDGWKQIMGWCEKRLSGCRLRENGEEYRKKCGGRVGVLLRWLTTAINASEHDQGEVEAYIARSQPSNRQQDKWKEEDDSGKALMGAVTDNFTSGCFDPNHWPKRQKAKK
jgi:hypothetical protein